MTDLSTAFLNKILWVISCHYFCWLHTKLLKAIMTLLLLTVHTDHQDKSPQRTYTYFGLLIILSITIHFETFPTTATDSSRYTLALSVLPCHAFQSHVPRGRFLTRLPISFLDPASYRNGIPKMNREKVNIYISSTIIQEITFGAYFLIA